MQMLHRQLIRNPGMRVAVIRPTYKSVKENIIPQWRDKVLLHGFDPHPLNPIERTIGGTERVESLLYRNKSRMVFGGMDDSGKILGGEFDIIFYNQVEQGLEEDWEVLWSRLRWGRWKYPYGYGSKLLIGDCNPSRRKHWILNRAEQGKTKLCYVGLDSNPYLFYNGDWTEEGEIYREDCKLRFTGLRLRRGLYGEWCSPDGLVYEYDPDKHDMKLMKDEIGKDWKFSAAIDHGERNPFVFQLYCGPPDKSYVVLYKEIYKPGLDTDQMRNMVDDLLKKHLPHGKTAKDLQWTVADHRPGINKTIGKIGLPIENADKELEPGIDCVQLCLRDEKVFFNVDSLAHRPDRERNEKAWPIKTVEEFDRYAFRDEDKLDGSDKDEQPVDAFNDGMDTLRYELVKWNKPTVRIPTVRSNKKIVPKPFVPSYMR